jgi:4-hydroxythreonine-4-phosphate dehydrogenase
MSEKPIIAITMGDAAGVGPEIILRAFVDGHLQKICRPIVIGSAKVLNKAKLLLGNKPLMIISRQDVDECRYLKETIDLIDIDNLNLSEVNTGKICPACGRAAIEYLDKAIDLALEKKVDAITTAPLNKAAVNAARIPFEGHTPYLAARTRAKEYGMMFVSENFWVVLVTTHLPLKKVPSKINQKSVLRTIKLAHQALIDAGKQKGRIGVAGLNPHAGENDLFGSEDRHQILPAILKARKLGINATGPVSPDAIFNLASRGMFDMVVAMYHDQGLIPMKLISFGKSVNVTVGLPFVRTSVDHGTGFDIAGKGMANPSSLIEAIKVAALFVQSKNRN